MEILWILAGASGTAAIAALIMAGRRSRPPSNSFDSLGALQKSAELVEGGWQRGQLGSITVSTTAQENRVVVRNQDYHPQPPSPPPSPSQPPPSNP